jgi:hypothetical protein
MRSVLAPVTVIVSAAVRIPLTATAPAITRPALSTSMGNTNGGVRRQRGSDGPVALLMVSDSPAMPVACDVPNLSMPSHLGMNHSLPRDDRL